MVGTASAAEIHSRLSQTPKALDDHSIYYDERGSRIFERLCLDSRYYSYHNDLAVLKNNAATIADLIGSNMTLVDFGCGPCHKSALLLQDLKNPSGFVGLDIESTVLEQSKAMLQTQFPNVTIAMQQGDFLKKMHIDASGPKLGLLSGAVLPLYSDQGTSTVFCLDGLNLMVEMAVIVDNVMTALGDDGVFLASFDANQDPKLSIEQYMTTPLFSDLILHALSVLNDRYGTDFDVEAYSYECRWNGDEKRVEHHLVAMRNQVVMMDGKEYIFEKGASLRCHCGRKQSLEEFQKLLSTVGCVVKRTFWDDQAFICLAWIERE